MDWMLGAFVALPILAAMVFVVGCYLAEAVRKAWRRK